MNKAVIFLMLALVLVNIAAAENKVMILKLNYNNGTISLVDKTLKYGFSPDRRQQPFYGYRAEVMYAKIPEYSFKFSAPNEVFVDIMKEDGTLSGGKVILDSVDFALNIPYEDEVVSLNIYSPDEEKIAVFDLAEKKDTQVIKYLALTATILITLLVIAFLIVKKKK